MSNKTPMMYINEWLQKRSADYILRKEAVNLNAGQPTVLPYFKATLSILPRDSSRNLVKYVVSAEGRNKKTAEQLAAQAMMTDLGIELTTREGAAAFLPKVPASSAAFDASIPELDNLDTLEKASEYNVGKELKDWCEDKRIDEPVLLFEDFGPAHSKVFRCTVEFQGIQKQGTARTKGDSKKIARFKLYTELMAKGGKKSIRTEHCDEDEKMMNVEEEEEKRVYRYNGRTACDVELEGKQCSDKLDHIGHQLLREIPTNGPELKKLVDATSELLANTFEVNPRQELEDLLKAKGELDPVIFFHRLMDELTMKVEEFHVCSAEKKEDMDSKESKTEDLDSNESESDNLDSNESCDTHSIEEDFYSCGSDFSDDEMDTSEGIDGKPSDQPAEKPESEGNNNNPQKYNLINLSCSVMGKDSKRPISVSAFGCGDTKTLAYKIAVTEILACIAVLCR